MEEEESTGSVSLSRSPQLILANESCAFSPHPQILLRLSFLTFDRRQHLGGGNGAEEEKMGQKMLHHKAVPLLSFKVPFVFAPEERIRGVF